MIARILLIVVLNMVWVGMMIGTLIIPTMPEFVENSTVNSVLGSLLCNPNERLQRLQADETIQTMCMNVTTEISRDVSDKLFTGGLIGTIIAFMLSTTAEVLFAVSLRRKKVTPKAPIAEVVVKPPQPEINITETLRQLEEAQKSGLMTYDEYDQKRQDIFKNL